MQISFFEEFPSERNLSTLKLITWPSKLYIAAEKVQEFKKIVARIKHKNVKEYIYWPILKRREGYWISPFSQQKALSRIFKELEGEDIAVMLDLELPTTRNHLLYLTQAFNFFGNKRLIRRFIQKYPGEVYLAEYYPEGKRSELLLRFLGLHYAHPKVKVIKMLYHSMHNFDNSFLLQELRRGKEEYKRNFIAALGVIAPGIQGNEKALSPQQLENDLELAKKAGIKEVILFRLGGLNKEYIKILSHFMKQ